MWVVHSKAFAFLVKHIRQLNVIAECRHIQQKKTTIVYWPFIRDNPGEPGQPR